MSSRWWDFTVPNSANLRFGEPLHRPTLSLGRTLNPNAAQNRGDVNVMVEGETFFKYRRSRRN